jgi:hypothetical protein
VVVPPVLGLAASPPRRTMRSPGVKLEINVSARAVESADIAAMTANAKALFLLIKRIGSPCICFATIGQ